MYEQHILYDTDLEYIGNENQTILRSLSQIEHCSYHFHKIRQYHLFVIVNNDRATV